MVCIVYHPHYFTFNRLGVVGYLLYFIYFLSFVSFVLLLFSACTGATSRHMAFFLFCFFYFSACTEGIRLVLYINSINLHVNILASSPIS
jgi:hypothetical protein